MVSWETKKSKIVDMTEEDFDKVCHEEITVKQ